MKKTIATIAIIILSWSGSIAATELSKEGCEDFRLFRLQEAIKHKDIRMIENLVNVVTTETKRKEYCAGIKAVMEIKGVKENDETWNSVLEEFYLKKYWTETKEILDHWGEQ